MAELVRETAPPKAIDQVVGEYEQVEERLIGEETMPGNFAQGVVAFELTNDQLDARPAVVEAPEVERLQGKVGDQNLIAIPAELEQRQLLAGLLGLRAANDDEAILAPPAGRLVGELGNLHPSVGGHVAKVRQPAFDGSGQARHDHEPRPLGLQPFDDYVMGSRFRGNIEPQAMPKLHRYFGTPVTTSSSIVIFGWRFSDIHCGMRGIRREALLRLDLRSQSWQYASEMTIKAVHLGLKCTEVPIDFYKDQADRQSHMKRSGWVEPWRAGRQNLEAMFVYGVDFFAFRPGLLLLATSLAHCCP